MTNIEEQPVETTGQIEDALNPSSLPTLPVEVFGINTQDLLAFGRIAEHSTLFPKEIALLPQVVAFIPLIEKAQSTTPVTVEDVAPYRSLISVAFPKVTFVEKAVTKIGSETLQHTLDRKVTKEVVKRTDEVLGGNEKTIQELRETLEHITQFENPQQQFKKEMNLLSETVRTAIHRERDLRLAGEAKQEERIPGWKGFAIRAVRKVKGFFKRLFGKREDQSTFTAYDAGAGIDTTIRDIRERPEVAGKFQLLGRFIQKYAPVHSAINKEYYSFAAPEILSYIYSVTPRAFEDNVLFRDVESNPHDFRFLTRYKKTFKGMNLERIQSTSQTLIPAFMRLLPNSLEKTLDTFYQMNNLFTQKEQEEKNDEPASKLGSAIKSAFEHSKEKLAAKGAKVWGWVKNQKK